MIEETIQINKLNLQFENKFNDEYFLLINGIDNFLFEEKIYISNYGENVADIEINNLELELYKYKFVYNEILNQKTNLEIKIKDIENKIQLNKKINDNKYKNTIIYMIRPKHNNFYMYIGHTIDKERRLKEHKRSTENDNKKIYKTIRETGGWEHWELIELASYVCECREDALKIEQEWCEKLRPNLNSNSPFA